MMYIGNNTIKIEKTIKNSQNIFSMLHFFFILSPPYTLTKRSFTFFKSQFKNNVKITIKIIKITPIAAAIPGLFNCTKYFSINTPNIGYDGAKIYGNMNSFHASIERRTNTEEIARSEERRVGKERRYGRRSQREREKEQSESR